MSELIKGDIKIEFSHEGEGLNGFFDIDNPNDKPLLRFYCYVKGDLRQEYLNKNKYALNDWGLHWKDSDWIGLADASYCTQLSADLALEEQQKALAKLMTKLHDPITKLLPKKAAEDASWISV